MGVLGRSFLRFGRFEAKQSGTSGDRYPSMNSVVKLEHKDVDAIPFQEASLDIWDKKYRLSAKDGTPVDKTMDDTYKRVARALADVEHESVREQWYERFVWALRRGAIPAGRVTSNAGALEHKPATSTINCTVSGTIGDSMDDILNKVHEAGLTLKAGCGIGYEFSTLRPRGAYVSGAGAYTSGPLSFMDIYDKMCFTVSSAGGRRGAQMGTFDVGHPDAMEFIRAKRENGRLRQFNLSLLVTDDFMKAVRADTDWNLAFPLLTKEYDPAEHKLDDATKFVWREWPTTKNYVTREDGLVCCKIYKTLPARRMWDVIMTSTYDFAEPGFILIDRVNEMNNNWWCENIRATNPCVPADTWVQTSEGPRQVAELIGKPFTARVDGVDHASAPEGFFRTAREAAGEPDDGRRALAAPHVRSPRAPHLHADALPPGDRVVRRRRSQGGRQGAAAGSSQGGRVGRCPNAKTAARTRATSWACWSATAPSPRTARSCPIWARSARRQQRHRCRRTAFGHGGGARCRALLQPSRRFLRLAPGRGPRRVPPRAWAPSPSWRANSACGPAARPSRPPSNALRASSIAASCAACSTPTAACRATRLKGVSVRLAQSGPASARRCAAHAAASRHRRRACTSARSTNWSSPARTSRDSPKLIGFADTVKRARLARLLGGYKRTLNRERFVATVESVARRRHGRRVRRADPRHQRVRCQRFPRAQLRRAAAAAVWLVPAGLGEPHALREERVHGFRRVRLERIPRSREGVHAHARQRVRDQRPAARAAARARSCASAATAWASSGSAAPSPAWA